MDLPILVDSNIYIKLLRQRLDPAVELTRNLGLTDLATCGIVRVEVLRGIRDVPVRESLRNFFDILQNVPTDNRLWEETSVMAWELDRKGWIIPAQDVLIACAALRIGATLLTTDKHFARIPGLAVRAWPPR